MIDFKCEVCNKWTNLKDIVQLNLSPKDKKRWAEIRACEICLIDYCIDENVIINITYRTTIREIKYYWSLYVEEGKSSIRTERGDVHDFDFIPKDITPENIKEKLTKYLTFL